MTKVLLAKDLKSLFMSKNSFLDRADIKVFSATTNDEALMIHRHEKLDLIVTKLDAPGIRSEEFFSIIRSSEELRAVSTIIVSEDTLANRERCKHCKVNAVFTIPANEGLLHMQVQQYLNVAPRMAYRAAMAVAISGKFKNQPRPFRTENISASGMLINAEEPLAKGDGIFFSFFLSDGAHVSGYGEIIRTVQHAAAPVAYSYGVKFTNIDPDDRAAIERAAKK